MTTFLGLALIAFVWTAVAFYLVSERAQAESDAVKANTNLTRLFEEHIVGLIKSNDLVLRQLQAAAASGTLAAGFREFAEQLGEGNEPAYQLSLLDADGYITHSNRAPVTEIINIAEREHFKVHVGAIDIGLFISAPIVGRLSQQTSIQLTRALRTKDGAFAGVAVASLSTARLARFYELVDLGKDGAINLVGFDGIVRASAGMRIANTGSSMASRGLLQRAAQAAEGWYLTKGSIDGIKRYMTFRRVERYPLVLAVGRSEAAVLGQYWQANNTVLTLASCLTLFILIVVAANCQRVRSLEIARSIARKKSSELELTLDHMSQGIFMVDAELNLALMNKQAAKLLGLPEDFVTRRPKFQDVLAYQLEHDEFGANLQAADPNLRELVLGGGVAGQDAVYERTRPNGTVLEVHSVPLPDGGFVRTFTDISERKRNADRIAHMAHHDALTGLPNRVLLRTRIEAAWRRQRRNRDCFALLLVDLDHFKEVNDMLGHAAGDELLRIVSERLQECVRDGDIVARLGGDEFAIFQDAVSERSDVEALARRVVEAVGAPYVLAGNPATIGASIGIATSMDISDIEQLLHNADLALYRVKSEGRNGFRLFAPEMDATAQARRQLESDLRHARERGEFEMVYQPIIDLGSGRVVNVEALLRWNHPVHGCMTPGQFLPLAEDIGVMPSVDTWVLQTACAEAMRWPGEIELAVNLSPAKFKRRSLLDVVRRTLAATGLPARRLELEISEHTMLHEVVDSMSMLEALREIGVRIALDDFGTGHSSLSDLRAFSFDKIKIDQSFVADIDRRADCAAIVSAIAGMGRSLGAQTTAEGIETTAQEALARAAGCTQGQGYLYGRPMPATALRALLADEGTSRAVA